MNQFFMQTKLKNLTPTLYIGALVFSMAALPAPCSYAASVTTGSAVTVPNHNPDYTRIFAQFDEGFENGNGSSFDDNSQGALGWMQSYHMLGYMSQYRATSNTLWLDKISTQFTRVLEKRDDRLNRKDIYTKTALKGWGTSRYDDKGWHVFVVHTGMICQAPADFVKIVKANPALNKKYGATADNFLLEIESIVDDADQYWDNKTTSSGEGYYTDPRLGILPLNQSTAMGSVLVELYNITGKEKYKAKATKLATFVKNSMHPAKDGTLNWSYWTNASSDAISHGEDISHAAISVDFACRCAAAGIVFTDRDIEKIALTWLKKVRKGQGWARLVDGTGEADERYIPQATGRWLCVIPFLPAPTAKEIYTNIASAYKGKTIDKPSSALGIANLARYSNPTKW